MPESHAALVGKDASPAPARGDSTTGGAPRETVCVPRMVTKKRREVPHPDLKFQL
jgi:hypothetical protein